MGKMDIRPRLDPQMAAALEAEARIAAETVARHGLENADPKDLTAARLQYNANRAYWNTDAPVMAESQDLLLPGPYRDIPARLHSPVQRGAEPAPVLIYLHGGGWIVGNLDTHDRIMRILAQKSGCCVLGVDYHLAPEAKFPQPQDECCAAADWVLQHGAEYGLDPNRIALAGDSAGANMSMTVLMHLKNQGRIGAVGAALLYYGSYGLRDSASRRLWGGAEDGLSAADLAFFRECLFEDQAEMLDPRFDILANDLTELPPLFVLEVAMDPLADDSRALADAVLEAGGQVDYRRAEGVLHGYLHMSHSVDAAMDALSDGAAFLRARM
ncbi:MAG: alpha/beta hydrolase fold domain-containing protein [Alphaproteobacteria bacterium]